MLLPPFLVFGSQVDVAFWCAGVAGMPCSASGRGKDHEMLSGGVKIG